LKEESWGRQGWSTPTEIDVSFGDWQLIDIIQHQHTGIGAWVAENSKVLDTATPRGQCTGGVRRLKTTSCENCRICCLLATLAYVENKVQFRKQPATLMSIAVV